MASCPISFRSSHCFPSSRCIIISHHVILLHHSRSYIPSHYPLGWSNGAMVLGKLPVLGHPTIWILVGQGPTALAVGADGGCLDIFSHLFSLLSPFLWETARYRLKHCQKAVKPTTTNQPSHQLPIIPSHPIIPLP